MMKSLFALVFTFLLISCSSTYKTTYFSPKEDFNKYFNEKVKDENLKILLINDSVLITDFKTIIKNDTLLLYTKKTIDEKIPLSEITSIHYTVDYHSASLSLKNRENIFAKDLEFQVDSLKYKVNGTQAIQRTIPLKLINEISYKSHWRGTIPGFLGGILVGGAIGASGLVINIKDGGMQEKFDPASSALFGSFFGMLIGPIVGYIIGFEYSFEFNN